MKTKNLLLKNSFLFAVGILNIQQVKSQIVGTDAFLKGNYVEIGIKGNGAHEGAIATAPAGMHFRGSTTIKGFMANPQMDGWVNYDGDYFTPGSPENGWGLKIAGLAKGNNANSVTDILGSITGWAHTGTVTTTDWLGLDTATGIKVNINYSLGDNDLFYITTVTITNTSSLTINNIYYYRNLDPDNNQSAPGGGSFVTDQTLVSQYGSCVGCYAQVTSTQSLPWLSYFSFLATDNNFKAGYGGFSNRDGENMYNGTGFVQTVGATHAADEAIYLAYKIASLPPGPSFKSTSGLATGIPHVFKFASIFKPSAVLAAQNALLASTSVGINEIKNVNNAISIYPNPISDNATITLNSSINLSNAEFQIYDVIGKLIKSTPVNSHEFTFEKGNLSGGLYFYKLINNGSELSTGKFLVK
jgi:hypothetical protein